MSDHPGTIDCDAIDLTEICCAPPRTASMPGAFGGLNWSATLGLVRGPLSAAARRGTVGMWSSPVIPPRRHHLADRERCWWPESRSDRSRKVEYRSSSSESSSFSRYAPRWPTDAPNAPAVWKLARRNREPGEHPRLGPRTCRTSRNSVELWLRTEPADGVVCANAAVGDLCHHHADAASRSELRRIRQQAVTVKLYHRRPRQRLPRPSKPLHRSETEAHCIPDLNGIGAPGSPRQLAARTSRSHPSHATRIRHSLPQPQASVRSPLP